jgi:hypothetical protein
MRLDVKRVGGNNVHSDLVAAVGWNSRNELFSCGDDKQIARWDVHGESGGKVRFLHAPARDTRHANTKDRSQTRRLQRSRLRVISTTTRDPAPTSQHR